MSDLSLITIAKPTAKKRIIIPTKSKQDVAFGFELSDVRLMAINGNLSIAFSDGGVIVLQGLMAAAAKAERAPLLTDASGEIISSYDLLAFLGVSEQELAAAASLDTAPRFGATALREQQSAEARAEELDMYVKGLLGVLEQNPLSAPTKGMAHFSDYKARQSVVRDKADKDELGARSYLIIDANGAPSGLMSEKKVA